MQKICQIDHLEHMLARFSGGELYEAVGQCERAARIELDPIKDLAHRRRFGLALLHFDQGGNCRDSLNLELWSLNVELADAPRCTKNEKNLIFQQVSTT
ncbi:hypothetical protein [Burkholderia pseudomallei]|uniref:hypothetical protein n=1 Tax=Burkholderia pseudomallei TaxID=28450 RepID=UPI0011777060|nr:hypothetical protein [Burkholderia pseudomallei]MCL4671215.1 hypothetical protein [Burkholderia pseudomallei]